MYDYSAQLENFHDEKVRLPSVMSDRLVEHRTANEDRLISRLPEKRKGLRISRGSFRSQGSFAMRTIVQTRFDDDEYDIDDGVLLDKADLLTPSGTEMTTSEVTELVRSTLEDKRFKKQPVCRTNCVRVFYADEDEYKHHVDFPIYRTYTTSGGVYIQELASQSGWLASNPTLVNVWFEDTIKRLESQKNGSGTQLRRLIRMLKRFCRSREGWDLPNGLKLTMLATECAEYHERFDVAFVSLLDRLDGRLRISLEIENLADPQSPKPKLTKSAFDPNMAELRKRIGEARTKLSVLSDDDCTKVAAKTAWDWVFQSDGYFDSLDDNDDGGNNGGGGGAGKSALSGIAISTPAAPVDHRGGGRFG